MIEHISIKDAFIFCETCRKLTNQLLLEELEDLVIIGHDSLLQKFKCGTCQRTNKRILHKCWNCKKFTLQTLEDEKNSDMIVDMVEQMFKCDVCEEKNEAERYSDEHIERFLKAKDEEGGVYCDYCMCYKKQELIDKQPSVYGTHDLTTYKCKTCGKTNYGTEDKKDTP